MFYDIVHGALIYSTILYQDIYRPSGHVLTRSVRFPGRGASKVNHVFDGLGSLDPASICKYS
jgi:hypothetical protein